MKKGFKTGVCLLALTMGTNSVAQAAVNSKCASPAEVSALRTAMVQQTLMNAGIGCGTNAAETKYWVGNFNAFQTAYLTELRKSDALMLAMFKRLQGSIKGDRAYNAFKTQVANAAGMRRIKSMQDFCKSAELVFAAALAPNRPKLADFVAGIPVEDASPVDACEIRVAVGLSGVQAAPHVVPKPRPDRPGEVPATATPIATPATSPALAPSGR
jgi:hypothetical protein